MLLHNVFLVKATQNSLKGFRLGDQIDYLQEHFFSSLLDLLSYRY
jgi:hypothetical protein